jgi:membrane protein required for colicin V production
MDWLTVVLLAFIGFISFRAYRNGFIRELVSLSAVILAIPVAGIFYNEMFPKVQPIVDNEKLAYLISFLSIFIGVIIAGQVISTVLRGFVSMLNLGVLDHAAGGAFGLLKAILVAQVVLSVLVVYPSPDVRGPVDDSRLATRLLESAPLVRTILPARFEDGVDLFLAGTAAIEGQLPGKASATATPAAR